MSATVCETVHVHDTHTSVPRPGRYRWPSFNSLRGGTSSSSRSKSRLSALRVVSSDTTPTPAQKPAASSPTVPAVPVSTSSDYPARNTSASAFVADAIREQARLGSETEPATLKPAPKLAKAHHVRAKSTTAVGEPSFSRLDSPSARTTPRARASSSATMAAYPPTRTRVRLPSMLSSVLTNPRAAVQTRMTATADSDLVGSFAPTSSPRERLLSLLATGGVAPSPTPSAPPSPRRTPLRLSTDHLRGAKSPASRHRRRTASSPIDSPSSPLPSICRTPSSYSSSEYFPTAPSSAGPATPVHAAAALPPSLARKSESLHPVLEGLERASMFAVQTACATCGRGGSNFPCCPKCGEMWCSRACRLQKGNGKRHTCAARRG